MSELAASATNSIQQQTTPTQNGDTYIFVPVSVRMEGQKMQLDFKVDSKTLAAAEQLRMAVVRSGVVEKNNSSSTNPTVFSNNCPPSTSNAAISLSNQTGVVSDRTKSALRKIVSPNNNNNNNKPILNQFQTDFNQRNLNLDSYSAPATPKVEELLINNNLSDPKCVSSKGIKNARTLLAEKLRKSKQTTSTSAATVNGKKPLLTKKSSNSSSFSSKKFKTELEIHSTPSSPSLDVNNLHKFSYHKQNFDAISPTVGINNNNNNNNNNNGFNLPSSSSNYFRFGSAETPAHQLQQNLNGYQFPQELYHSELITTNGGTVDYHHDDQQQQKAAVYFQQLTNLSLPDRQEPPAPPTPTMIPNHQGSTPTVIPNHQGPTPTMIVPNRQGALPPPPLMIRDTVERACDAVVASCRQLSYNNNNNLEAGHSPTTLINDYLTDQDKLLLMHSSSGIINFDHQDKGGLLQNGIITVPADHHPVKKSSRSKSAPSAMCGFLNAEGNKQCRQRCINGFKFCIRHILNDADAPYHPCAYVKVQGCKQIKCNNAVPNHQETEYCGTHLIMKGLRQPKTKKKKKDSIVTTATSNSNTTNCIPLPTPSITSVQDNYYHQADAAQVYSNTPSNSLVNNCDIPTTANNNNIINNANNNIINNNNNISSSTSISATKMNNQNINGSLMETDENLSKFYSNDNFGYSPHYSTNFCHQQQQQTCNAVVGGSFNQHQQQRSSSTSSSNTNPNTNCFDFSSAATPRPDSHLSSGVSPYLNGYIHLHSPPQSPWKMPTTPNTQQQNGGHSMVSNNGQTSSTPNVICGSDLARSHPELLSKLAGAETSSSMVMMAGGGGAGVGSGQGLRAFANVVTSAMFEDSNSSYGGCAPFQQHQPQHQQRYSFTNTNGNPLMLGEDPFLGPPAHQSLLTNENSSSAAILSTPTINNTSLGVMPSPVPSDLSVESVGSHMSAGFQPTYQISNGIHRPSPPMSGYQTPSPSVNGGTFGVHYYTGMSSQMPFFGPLATSPSSSSNLGSFQGPSGSAHLLSGSQSSAEVNEPSVQLQYGNGRREFGGVRCSKDAQVIISSPHPVTGGSGDTPAKSVAAGAATTPCSLSTKNNNNNNVASCTPSSKSSVAANSKLKKVIRLKPKKRRMKMMGKYRQIPAVGQMCRVIEDLQFDKTDLFPLGLEPSSSDSENEDDTKPFLPFMDGLYCISSEIDDQAAAASSKNDSSLTSNVVSAARRQLYMLKKSLSFSNKELRKKNLETKFVGSASRYYPNSVGNALFDLTSGGVNGVCSKEKSKLKSKKLQQHQELNCYSTNKRCSYEITVGDSQVKCSNECLPYCNSCLMHVLHNVDQQLFRYCMSDGGGCKVPAVDVGLADVPRCPVHQDRNAYRAVAKLKDIVPDDHCASAKKKIYKSRYIVKKHRRRKNKAAAAATTAFPNADERAHSVQDEMTEEDDESEKEDDSNQEAQAALASVARDFGFGAHDLSDILVRMPDATLIENILGQELSRTENMTGVKEEMDSIDRVLTATVGDHNWADVEQFLMEENYKSSSSPEYQVPSAAAVASTSTTTIVTLQGNVVGAPSQSSSSSSSPFCWPQPMHQRKP